jgi:hypothetical protein
MRFAVAMLICLGVGPIALADAPPPPPTPPAAAASSLTPASAAAPESERTQAPPQVAPASAAAAPATASPAAESPKPAATTDPRVKQLLAKGFRPETRNGEKVYCKTEEVIGSRIATKRVCGTVDELQSREQNYKDAAQSAQQHQLNPTGN